MLAKPQFKKTPDDGHIRPKHVVLLQILRIYIFYTGCHRRNGPNFGRVFLMLNYTDITQNTYIQS